MNEFNYLDPFYREQSSTSPFNMQVGLIEMDKIPKIYQLKDIENLTIENDKKNILGAFSNSLHFTIPRISFGKINDSELDFEMEYYLTNSDSYGMMSGSIDEHIKSSGLIQKSLEIKELVVFIQKGKNIVEF